MWMVGDSVELIQRGFRFLCVADPVDLCEQALTAQVAALRARVVPQANRGSE